MAKIQICLGFHSYGVCTTQFAVALAGVTRYEGSRLTSMIHIPSPYVTEARNKIVKQFLTKTRASHLLMLDVDEEFPEDAVEETLLAMHLHDAEVVFGCYALGDFRPSIFKAPEPGGHLPHIYSDLEADKDYEIFAGSTGWLLATREALQKIWTANAERHWPWFDHDVEISDGLPGDLLRESDKTLRLGEDFSFSKRARECGIKLWGTTRPLIIHGKVQPLLPHFMEKKAAAMGLRVNNQTGDLKPVEKEKENVGEGSQGVVAGGEVCASGSGSDSGSAEAPSGSGVGEVPGEVNAGS